MASRLPLFFLGLSLVTFRLFDAYRTTFPLVIGQRKPPLASATNHATFSPQVYYETTSDLSKSCGLAAVKSRVKAYVRLTHPFYAHLDGQVNSEADQIVPDGPRGYWWHESLRALACIPE